tara:strand:- start:469 stop:1053 length:585 start_codon:yes stop_codon:yes gene_type:complete
MINFNTTRFIDVTTSRQASKGTMVFHDTTNPGVFYASYASGYVRRIIKTITQTSSPFGSSSTNNTVMYPLNARKTSTHDNDNTYVTINSVSNRLGRIAEMADKFNSQRGSIVSSAVDGDIVTVTVPRIISSIPSRQAPSIPVPTNADLNQTEEVTIAEDSTPTKRRRRRRGNNSNSRRRHSSNRRNRSRNNTKA